MTEEKEKLQSVIYLENRIRIADREILSLKQNINDSLAELRAKDEIIKALEKTNERLLKTIENNNAWKGIN